MEKIFCKLFLDQVNYQKKGKNPNIIVIDKIRIIDNIFNPRFRPSVSSFVSITEDKNLILNSLKFIKSNKLILN